MSKRRGNRSARIRRAISRVPVYNSVDEWFLHACGIECPAILLIEASRKEVILVSATASEAVVVSTE
jgi:hypothetical protein